jgi:hypothetical protein
MFFVRLYFVVFLTPFQCSFSFVYLYLVVNLSNELDFDWHFAYEIRNENKLLMEQMTHSEIYKILFFEKMKLITTKLLYPQKVI